MNQPPPPYGARVGKHEGSVVPRACPRCPDFLDSKYPLDVVAAAG